MFCPVQRESVLRAMTHESTVCLWELLLVLTKRNTAKRKERKEEAREGLAYSRALYPRIKMKTTRETKHRLQRANLFFIPHEVSRLDVCLKSQAQAGKSTKVEVQFLHNLCAVWRIQESSRAAASRPSWVPIATPIPPILTAQNRRSETDSTIGCLFCPIPR